MGVVADLYDYLEAQGIAGGSTDWSLLRRRDMDEPAMQQLVVLTEDGGPAPEFPADTGIGDSAMQDSGVMVTVRGEPHDGDSSADKAAEIFAALHGQRDIVLGNASGSVQYYRVSAVTAEPVFIGFDERERPRHTIAFRLLHDVAVN